jgi:2-polyprenyl-6-methoxyphenol hydroxylase-like FAD-dependent oxidoreductase
LIRRALAEPTVAFRERTAVTALIREGGRVVGATIAGGDSVTARIVVGADGRTSFVAADVGAVEQIREPAARAAWPPRQRGE